MAPDILTRLLRGEHLNMEQRAELGIWPHPPLGYADELGHLAGVLERKLAARERGRRPSPEKLCSKVA